MAPSLLTAAWIAVRSEHEEDQVDLLGRLSQELTFAFQPIVAMATGEVVGVEALMRGYDRLGFGSVPALLDHAHARGALNAIELLLRERAIDAYASFGPALGARLFLNIDNRTLTQGDGGLAQLDRALVRHQLGPAALCVELSEGNPLPDQAQGLLQPFRERGFALALDDYGAGHSSLRRLHELAPDVLKIDRYFVAGLAEDNKRRLLLGTMATTARVLGIPVVAEGVETEKEYLICRELGCTFAQGYFIGRPDGVPPDANAVATRIQMVNSADRRRNDTEDHRFVREHLASQTPLRDDAPMIEVLEFFRTQADHQFAPVVDVNGRPRGVIREATMKHHVYAPYGKELLAKRRGGVTLDRFLSTCPICEIDTDLDLILEAFALSADQVGAIITEHGRYLGVLDAKALLQAINERNLSFARDQNPLTRLPGNRSIERYIARAVEGDDAAYVFAYLDLDNFKPFNDHFGFRLGDRVIRALGDLLRSRLERFGGFVGHIGGDDFFFGVRSPDRSVLESELLRLLSDFADDARGFYDDEARANGHIVGRDRDGNIKQIPLLTCSAAVLWLPAGGRGPCVETLNRQLVDAKHAAKRAATRVATIDFDPRSE